MSIKKIIREYFSYSASEKRGLLVLVVILMIVIVLPSILNKEVQPVELSNKNEKLDSLLTVLRKKEEKKFNLFPFDPNITSKKDLIKLGFNGIQIGNLLKYRESGGVFKSKLDLKKIYGITNQDYNRFKDYIYINYKEGNESLALKKNTEELKLFHFDPNSISTENWEKLGVGKSMANRIKKYLSTGARFKSPEDVVKIYGFDSILFGKLKPYIKIEPIKENSVRYNLVDLNIADTTLFKTLPGIGSVLSQRIVKYRNLLGGFSKVEQLTEVYGISKSTFERIRERIEINTNPLKQISINDCGAGALRKHPYITKRAASDIIKYRERVGKFESIEDLRTKNLLNDTIYQKLIPYLSLD